MSAVCNIVESVKNKSEQDLRAQLRSHFLYVVSNIAGKMT